MSNGESRNLEMMPSVKCDFPLVLWKKHGIFFTVGGEGKEKISVLDGDSLLERKRNEVEEYSILKNKWKLHSLLP